MTYSRRKRIENEKFKKIFEVGKKQLEQLLKFGINLPIAAG